MCRRGCVAARSHTHTRARARTQHVGRVYAAGAHRRSVHRCSQTHGCRYMQTSRTHILYLCVFHRWMALQSERAALAHEPRISASSAPARDRTHTQEHTRVPIYIRGLCIDRYIYSYMTCALAIYPGGRAHARTCQMATAASSARATARTCALKAVQPHARHPSLTKTYIPIHICIMHTYYIHICIYT
jgi:hypothetical protein